MNVRIIVPSQQHTLDTTGEIAPLVVCAADSTATSTLDAIEIEPESYGEKELYDDWLAEQRRASLVPPVRFLNKATRPKKVRPHRCARKRWRRRK